MVTKILGYILALIGIIALAAGMVPQIKEQLTFLPAEITTTILIVAGVILVLVGLFFVMRSGGRRSRGGEVPIYHGKNVVGYRRY